MPELHGCSTVAGCVDLLGEFDTSEARKEDSTRLHVPSGTALRVGAAATLQAVEDYVAPYAASSSTATALLSAISNFGWGGHQLRAAATLGGSVCFAPSYSVPQLTNFNPLFLCRFFHRFSAVFCPFSPLGARKPESANRRRRNGERRARNSRETAVLKVALGAEFHPPPLLARSDTEIGAHFTSRRGRGRAPRGVHG